MMSCHDAREQFSGWVDEALVAEERAAVAAHLAECPDCRRELDRFQATIGLLQRVEPSRAPAGFVDRVLDRTRPMSWRRRLLQRLFFPLPVKLPAEAAALLLVAGLAVYVFHRTPELQQAARPPEVSQPAARVDAPAASSPARAVAPRDARPTPQFEAPAQLQGSVRPEEGVAKPPASPPTSSPASPPTSPLASPPGSQEMAKTGTVVGPPSPDAPPSGAAPPTVAAPPPAPSVEAKKEMRDEARGVPPASEPAPTPARPTPAVEGRADSARQKALRAPERMTPSSSAMRVLPSADVAGRLTVTDRGAALRALVELLARTQGTEIARRPEPGATVVDVVVPATSYAEFSRGLARIGAWLPEAEPSDLPFRVRVTLRLTE